MRISRAKRIAVQASTMRLEGKKIEAIALRLNVSARTVERALALTGTKLPEDRFWCGHEKIPENCRYTRSDGKAVCRLCKNKNQLRHWYRKQGRDPCYLANFWRGA